MKAFLSLGSNMGDRQGYLERALHELESHLGKCVALSSIYDTPPWGKTDQDHFFNQAVIFQTEKNPFELLDLILRIEMKMGRRRTEKWGPRIIDIDLIFLDDLVLNSDQLQIPHPDMTRRRFVLAPLAEIASNFIHPIEKQTVKWLLEHCPDESVVRLIKKC